MKIVIDDKIPYIRGVFEPVAEVVYLPGSRTTPEVVHTADALITRTRTLCNAKLLEGSSVRFIATATIGFDHIDVDYCKRAGIQWGNAPGCNAGSVEQYIASALLLWAGEKNAPLRGKTLGIVGVGNVGSKIGRLGNILGMRVLLNDPPRERVEGPGAFVSLETIRREADIITFHVPLNMTGEDATYHMVNRIFLSEMGKTPLLINSCRGEVFDTPANTEAIENHVVSGFIADCWENEPEISLRLMNQCFLATPHIAGYSKDGKANGTRMSVQAVSRFFNLGMDDWQPHDIEMPERTVVEIDGAGRNGESILREAVLATYDIRSDDQALRSNPAGFEKLRGDYPVRREFPAYTAALRNVPNPVAEKLKLLGFKIKL